MVFYVVFLFVYFQSFDFSGTLTSDVEAHYWGGVNTNGSKRILDTEQKTVAASYLAALQQDVTQIHGKALSSWCKSIVPVNDEVKVSDIKPDENNRGLCANVIVPFKQNETLYTKRMLF